MHPKVWIAYALMIRPALSQKPPSTIPLNLVSPGNDAPAANNRLPTSTQQSLNSSSLYDLSWAGSVNVTAGYIPKCEGFQFGFNLDRHSCFDAFRNIPPAPEPKKWGPRVQGVYDYVTLPFRWSSDDGQCVIDLMAKSQDNPSDSASLYEISMAAERVMQKCIDAPHNPTMGGCVGKVGNFERLVTVVRRYRPNVVCGDEFQGWEEASPSPCADTLSRIPVSVISIVFGREGVPGVTWELPWSYQASNSRCEFHLDLATGRLSSMRWFDIWAAAIAADVLCVRHGRSGTAHVEGSKSGWVTLKVKDPLLGAPASAVANGSDLQERST